MNPSTYVRLRVEIAMNGASSRTYNTYVQAHTHMPHHTTHTHTHARTHTHTHKPHTNHAILSRPAPAKSRSSRDKRPVERDHVMSGPHVSINTEDGIRVIGGQFSVCPRCLKFSSHWPEPCRCVPRLKGSLSGTVSSSRTCQALHHVMTSSTKRTSAGEESISHFER